MAHSTLTHEEIRQKLLNAAKELFLENGIAGTEMKMVAERSGLSRSTLYRYTTDKDQLVFMVSLQIMTDFTESCINIEAEAGDTGYDKLRKFSTRMIDYLARRPEVSRFISEFDRLFTGDYPDIPEAQEYSHMMNRLLNRDAQFLFEGMADGSITPHERPLLFTSVLMNTIFSLCERLLPRDAHYLREHHASSRVIIDEAVRILLESVKVS